MTTATAMEPLTIETEAPDFDLPASSAEGNVKLLDFKGKNLILVFYPKDKTPGCTRQLCALRDDFGQFEKLNTSIIASNPGSLKSHESFTEKENYNFPILVDAEKTMAEAYQALKPEGGIQRTVYIINYTGDTPVIGYAKQGLPPDSELVEAIEKF